jgi:hypothetical protein
VDAWDKLDQFEPSPRKPRHWITQAVIGVACDLSVGGFAVYSALRHRWPSFALFAMLFVAGAFATNSQIRKHRQPTQASAHPFDADQRDYSGTDSEPWDEPGLGEDVESTSPLFPARSRGQRPHKSCRDLSSPGTLRALPVLLGAVAFCSVSVLVCVSNGHEFFLGCGAVLAAFAAWYLFRAVMVIVWWIRRDQ